MRQAKEEEMKGDEREKSRKEERRGRRGEAGNEKSE